MDSPATAVLRSICFLCRYPVRQTVELSVFWNAVKITWYIYEMHIMHVYVCVWVCVCLIFYTYVTKYVTWKLILCWWTTIALQNSSHHYWLLVSILSRLSYGLYVFIHWRKDTVRYWEWPVLPCQSLNTTFVKQALRKIILPCSICLQQEQDGRDHKEYTVKPLI